MSFRSRILSAFAGLVLLVGIAALAGLEVVVRLETRSRLAADLDAAGEALQSELRAEEAHLISGTRLAAGEPRIKAILSEPGVDEGTLADVAEDTRQTGGWNEFGLATADGAVQVVAGAAGHGAPALLRDALSGGAASGYWLVGDRLVLVGASRVEFDQHVVGAVLAGLDLSDPVVRSLGRRIHAEVAFFAGGRLAATSFSSGRHREALDGWAGTTIPGRVRLASEQFVAREVILVPGEVRGVLFYSEEAALAPLQRLRRAILSVNLAALVAAVAIAWVFARDLARPIAAIAAWARQVGAGRLDSRIVPAGGEELAALAATLNEMVAELERQRGRDQLAAFLVHDLKSPLSAVLVNAQMLSEEGILPALEKEAAEDIVESAEVMLGMVVDLLDVGQESGGKLSVCKATFDLAGLLEKVRQEASMRAAKGRQRLVLSAPPLSVHADLTLLRRVIVNLLDNSFKYAPPGSTVTIEARPSGEGQVEVRVSDQGPGIPPELRERIFDKYFRLERDAGAHARTSRGLGLTFCQMAVQAHDGRIWVEDNQPKGSVFCIRLPVGRG